MRGKYDFKKFTQLSYLSGLCGRFMIGMSCVHDLVKIKDNSYASCRSILKLIMTKLLKLFQIRLMLLLMIDHQLQDTNNAT